LSPSHFQDELVTEKPTSQVHQAAEHTHQDQTRLASDHKSEAHQEGCEAREQNSGFE
jgi:hypothetical protein